MPILVSVNLNKRLNNPKPRRNLEVWLSQNHAQIVCTQEPFKKAPISLKNLLANFYPIGGNGKVFTWATSQNRPSEHDLGSFWQRLQFGDFVIYNIYLDAYHQSARSTQLQEINSHILKESQHPTIIVGDFNLAPNPQDGLALGIPSNFNTETDRQPFRQLLASGNLIDLGYSSSQSKWTVVRKVKNGLIQFRCDLALTSKYISPLVRFNSDASTRSGPRAFTDHSGLILKIPILAHSQVSLFSDKEIPILEKNSLKISGKTAMYRSEPSLPAKILVERQLVKGKLFDWGCGHGADLNFFKKSGIEAEGWDPNHKPEKTPASYLTGLFNWVYCGYVLNTLSDPNERAKVLKEIYDFLPDGGNLAISVRSVAEIESVRKATWIRYGDGWLTTKNTFQKGFTATELKKLLEEDGFAIKEIVLEEPVVFVIAKKKRAMI